MELEKLRQEINSCDEELIKLIIKRTEISEKIGRFKAEKGMPVFDGKREENRKNFWQNNSGKYGKETLIVLRVLMALSKCRQGEFEKSDELEAIVAKEFSGLKNER